MKRLVFLVSLIMALMLSQSVFAHDGIWYDKNSSLGKINTFKVNSMYGEQYTTDNERNLYDRLKKKVPKTNFTFFDIDGNIGKISFFIRHNNEHSRISPAYDTTVTMTEYIQVTGSPQGDYRRNEYSWDEYVHVDETTVYYRDLDVDILVYDSNNNLIMTYNSLVKCSNYSVSDKYNDMIKDFVDAFKKARKECRKK